MGVPYTFASATNSIPLSQLDANFNTPVTIGSTTVGLGNTTTTLAGLANVSTTALTVTNDASISGLTVGKGGTSVSSNTAFGGSALSANTTGSENTAVGYIALAQNTSGAGNSAFGRGTLYSNTTGALNTALGDNALLNNSTGNNNNAVGHSSLTSNTTGSNNVSIGETALYSNTTASNNTAVGYQAGYSNATGSGSYGNAFFGALAGYSNTGNDNTYIGASAGRSATSGGGNIAIGWGAAYSGSSASIFSITTESDRIVMGTNNNTNAYIKIAWTVTSDARDKTDIANFPYGLDFVKGLTPVSYVWDERSNYENGIPDGRKKSTKKQAGFLAQDVIALEIQHGAQAKNLLIADDEQDDKLKITETKMIPALVKAIQELNTLVTTQAAQIAALQAKVGA